MRERKPPAGACSWGGFSSRDKTPFPRPRRPRLQTKDKTLRPRVDRMQRVFKFTRIHRELIQPGIDTRKRVTMQLIGRCANLHGGCLRSVQYAESAVCIRGKLRQSLGS